MSARAFALEVVRELRRHGFQSLWAGGCVRDELLGLRPHDFDVATDAPPQQVQRLFPRSLAVGAQFGVIEVLGPQSGLHVQVATFRSDGSYQDGRHPDNVRFGNAEEDAQRRDFTINGLFFDPVENRILDFVGGQADLAARVLRSIGRAAERFHEDKLRLLRAVRFAARFDLTMEPATRQAILAMAPLLRQVSAERITDELRKLAALPQRGVAYSELALLGLLPPIFGPWSSERSTFPTLTTLAGPVPFALVLADVLVELHGPDLDGVLHRFPLQKLAQHLRLSNEEREDTAWLLRHRDVLRQADRLSAARLKPLLAHRLREPLLSWLEARLQVASAATDCIHFCRKKLALWSRDELDPPPLVTGDDLLRAGYAAGPQFKDWLADLRSAQLNGDITTKEAGLELLGGWSKPTKKDA